jgi:hypothetical protein
MTRFVPLMLMLLSLGSALRGQSAPAAQSPASPDTGSVADGKYTNTFFGFSIALPQDPSLHNESLPYNDPRKKFLFGLKGQDHGFASFVVTAVVAASASSDDAKKEVSDARAGPPNKVRIADKEFWKTEYSDKSLGAKMQSVEYATPLGGYVLKFAIFSYDPKVTAEFVHTVESLTFFDPAKGKDKSRAGNQPSRQFLPIAAITSSVNSCVEALPPASGVR